MHVVLFFVTTISISSLFQGVSADYGDRASKSSSSPFEIALENLQKQLEQVFLLHHFLYKFQSGGLLRRAMTHPSFSGENNKALSILGIRVMETSVALSSLSRNTEISAKELNRLLIDVSEENACAADGLRLGLQNVVRVSSKTNASMPLIVCGAFRAVFGAIAVDATTVDAASKVFWIVHGDGDLPLLSS